MVASKQGKALVKTDIIVALPEGLCCSHPKIWPFVEATLAWCQHRFHLLPDAVGHFSSYQKVTMKFIHGVLIASTYHWENKYSSSCGS